jgi:hypothetical protein
MVRTDYWRDQQRFHPNPFANLNADPDLGQEKNGMAPAQGCGTK